MNTATMKTFKTFSAVCESWTRDHQARIRLNQWRDAAERRADCARRGNGAVAIMPRDFDSDADFINACWKVI